MMPHVNGMYDLCCQMGAGIVGLQREVQRLQNATPLGNIASLVSELREEVRDLRRSFEAGQISAAPAGLPPVPSPRRKLSYGGWRVDPRGRRRTWGWCWWSLRQMLSSSRPQMAW